MMCEDKIVCSSSPRQAISLAVEPRGSCPGVDLPRRAIVRARGSRGASSKNGFMMLAENRLLNTIERREAVGLY